MQFPHKVLYSWVLYILETSPENFFYGGIFKNFVYISKLHWEFFDILFDVFVLPILLFQFYEFHVCATCQSSS